MKCWHMNDMWAGGGFIGERQIPCDYVAVVIWEVFIVENSVSTTLL